jgi:hypothetical protein
MRTVGATALLLTSFCSHAQDVPSGWKVVKDKQGVCQMAVPADWVADRRISSFMTSPDGKANAVPHGMRTGQSFSEATTLAKQGLAPTKTIEDSSKRLWYAYKGAGTAAGGADWYVAVPGSPVCTAQIAFKAPALEETAKKIVLSLTQAK